MILCVREKEKKIKFKINEQKRLRRADTKFKILKEKKKLKALVFMGSGNISKKYIFFIKILYCICEG